MVPVKNKRQKNIFLVSSRMQISYDDLEYLEWAFLVSPPIYNTILPVSEDLESIFLVSTKYKDLQRIFLFFMLT